MPSSVPPAIVNAEIVDEAVAKLRLQYRESGLLKNASGTVPFGLFGNLVGAEVVAEQRIEVGKQPEYTCIRHVVVVACSGFGCTEAVSEVAVRNLIFDCDHGDITEEYRQAARKQAQAHAETCRALPRPTA